RTAGREEPEAPAPDVPAEPGVLVGPAVPGVPVGPDEPAGPGVLVGCCSGAGVVMGPSLSRRRVHDGPALALPRAAPSRPVPPRGIHAAGPAPWRPPHRSRPVAPTRPVPPGRHLRRRSHPRP